MIDLKPLSNNIIVDILEEDTINNVYKEDSKTGILVPKDKEKDKNNLIAKVLSVGSGYVGTNNERIPLDVKEGDYIVLSKHNNYRQIFYENKKYNLIADTDVFAIIQSKRG